MLRPRLSSLVSRPRLVSYCCWRIRTFACPSAHVFIICVHCAIVHCPLSTVPCPLSLTHYQSYHIVVITNVCCCCCQLRSLLLSPPLSFLLFLSLYLSLLLCLARHVCNWPKDIECALSLVQAIKRTHSQTLDAHSITDTHDTHSIWDKDMRCSSSST